MEKIRAERQFLENLIDAENAIFGIFGREKMPKNGIWAHFLCLFSRFLGFSRVF
jgi:hypothetical protein